MTQAGDKSPREAADGAAGAAAGRAGAGGGIAAAVAVAAKGRRGPAPVHLWDPPYCGEMDLEIRPDGAWIHEGSPIGRPAMVRLFASVLKREGDRFFLVTPVEKLGIRVVDAPFLAIDAEIGPDRIAFTTNVGDEVVAGPEHPIRVEDRDGVPRPYVHVRRGLEALIDRKSFYRLVAAAEPDADGRLVLRSQGAVFALEG
ncbi:DUF1285 domain-containing protein [Paracoccus sanguinis]|uniref:DUF1285 domain-containing protein n=1 Tax=Paracoccus sanguinis TaxID=1545044 RepID=UPI001451E84C|nr:DUF1285 domain-containing protein [Paracoccus sanguinis]QJD15688.1 DUF1285 domain-containing protein [Paracoccus sanguinis]